jgi:hypothetical protein
LQLWGSSSTIQLVSPLTKEQVSLDNGGGGNWGADGADIKQIKTTDAAPPSGVTKTMEAGVVRVLEAVGSESINVLSVEKEKMCPTSRQELAASSL